MDYNIIKVLIFLEGQKPLLKDSNMIRKSRNIVIIDYNEKILEEKVIRKELLYE